MRLSVRRALEPFARVLQQAYARVIRSGAPKAHPDGRPIGGSLSDEVTRSDLVGWGQAGFAFQPSQLGSRFRLWWYGTSRQPGRGREVPIDEARIAAAVEDALAEQIEAEDRRTT